METEQEQSLRSRLTTWVLRWRFPLSAAADSAFVAIAVATATVFRFEFELPLVVWERLAAFVVVAIAAHLALAMIEGLYMGVARFASFDELAGLARAVVGGTIVSALLNYFFLDRLVDIVFFFDIIVNFRSVWIDRQGNKVFHAWQGAVTYVVGAAFYVYIGLH